MMNPHVSRLTRGHIANLVKDKLIHDQEATLFYRALRHVGEIHPGGFVYQAARAYGATPEQADKRAVSATLHYLACSIIDDVQDNEIEYLDTTPAIAIGVGVQAYCLSLDLALKCGVSVSPSLDCGVIMLSGQNQDLTRSGRLSFSQYIDIAQKVAGYQYVTYFRIAAGPIQFKDNTGSTFAEWYTRWMQVGFIYGTLAQYHHDKNDERRRLINQGEQEYLQEFMGILAQNFNTIVEQMRGICRLVQADDADSAALTDVVKFLEIQKQAVSQAATGGQRENSNQEVVGDVC